MNRLRLPDCLLLPPVRACTSSRKSAPPCVIAQSHRHYDLHSETSLTADLCGPQSSDFRSHMKRVSFAIAASDCRLACSLLDPAAVLPLIWPIRTSASTRISISPSNLATRGILVMNCRNGIQDPTYISTLLDLRTDAVWPSHCSSSRLPTLNVLCP